MATEETDRLLRRARELAARSTAEDSSARREFDRAVNRLRRLSGRDSPSSEGSTFENEVAAVLFGIPDAVVALHPKASGATRRPDFLVSRGDVRLLVEAIGSPARWFSHSRVRKAARDLASELSTYTARRGLIVVPGKVYSSAAAIPLESSIDLVQLSELAYQVIRRLQGDDQ
jgi:hypothetical protein